MLLVKCILPDNGDTIDFVLCAAMTIDNEISLTRMKKVELSQFRLKTTKSRIFFALEAIHA